jgi:hypothetical protein
MNKPRKFDLVPFEDHHIMTTQQAEKVYVVVRPIVEMMGLNWSAQFRRIQRHPLLSKGVAVMATPSVGGEQEMVCLELEAFHGWLVTISPDRIADEDIRNLVLRYQEKAFRILFEHFHGPIKRPGTHNVSVSRGIDLRRQIRTSVFDYKAADTIGEKIVHYSTLQSAMGELGYNTPSMAQMDTSIEDGQQALLDAFWAGVATVVQAGHAVNHSRQNSLIALNLPELRRLFVENGVGLVIDRSVTSALRQCESPRFIASKPVNSKDGKVRECWVFAMPMLETATIEG